MAGWGNDPNATLRGLWGTLVNSAAAGQTTQDVWQQLRQAATNQAASVLGLTLGREPTLDEIDSAYRQMFGNVTVQHVNQWRKEAGRYVAAQRNLAATDSGVQIGGDAIYRRNTELWGGSSPIVPTYRIRVKYSYTVGTLQGEEWATYDIGGVITSLEDIQNKVSQQFKGKDYNKNTVMGDWLSYAIEER